MSYKEELFDLELRKKILNMEYYRIRDNEQRKKEIEELLEEIERSKKIIKGQIAKTYRKAGTSFKF